MVSRRNYFSIIIMMAVLFFMFQFSQIIKESGNRYDVNEHAVAIDKLPSGEAAWQPSETDAVYEESGYVLFFGDVESELGNIVTQWCHYSKKDLAVDKLSACKKPDVLPGLILLDAQLCDVGEQPDLLDSVLEWGVPIVFCNMPNAEEIEASEHLMDVFGLKEVRAKEVSVQGIRVFDGFLLGGEALYEPETEEDFKRQDMDFDIPWYVTGTGTKTYMVGILDEDEMDKEEFPSLIWRNTYEGTKVFAICGGYMSDVAGLGILSAITYELEPYQLYPVVNAQNVVIANFPGFTTENAETLMQLYSRIPKMIYQDIMWPSVSAMIKTNDLVVTCMFSPQYDYMDGIEPVAGEEVFYLQQLKELGSEAGMALDYKDNADVLQVLDSDKQFFEATEGDYKYQTLYVKEQDLEQIIAQTEAGGLLENVITITGNYSSDVPIIGYFTDNVTVQSTTGNAGEHTYTDNLNDRCLQTALGYSNVLLDLHGAIWPETTDDEWQNLYDEMSSNIHTYWSGDKGFTATTLSESDLRVRTFLNLDYENERKGNTIRLEISNVSTSSWFILRTHDEVIVDMQGGEYEMIERNVYLIKADEAVVEIQVEPQSLKEQGELIK